MVFVFVGSLVGCRALYYKDLSEDQRNRVNLFFAQQRQLTPHFDFVVSESVVADFNVPERTLSVDLVELQVPGSQVLAPALRFEMTLPASSSSNLEEVKVRRNYFFHSAYFTKDCSLDGLVFREHAVDPDQYYSGSLQWDYSDAYISFSETDDHYFWKIRDMVDQDTWKSFWANAQTFYEEFKEENPDLCQPKK